MFKKIIILTIILIFGFESTGFAQVAGQLDISAHVSAGLSNIIQDKFRPIHLRYLEFNPTQENFKLLLDKGSVKNPNQQLVDETTKELLKYFLIGVSLPNDAFWVNLRPDASNEIIDENLAKTDVGKILLEADLQLKKDTAKYTSPQTLEGKKYWNRLYQKAEELYGPQQTTIPTLNRPWIVPDEIIVRENQGSAYIYKATLKVMLEGDYLKNSQTYNFSDEKSKALNEYSSQLLKEQIIPKITKEINSAKRYAALRQVYYSLILAQWFKRKYNNAVIPAKAGIQNSSMSSKIDSKDLINLTSSESWSQETYYQSYQKSFKEGEYNIKEPRYTANGQVIRNYVSGGVVIGTGIAKILDDGGVFKSNSKINGAIEKDCLEANISSQELEIKKEDGETTSKKIPPFKEYPEFNFWIWPDIISTSKADFYLYKLENLFDSIEEKIYFEMSKIAEDNAVNLKDWLNFNYQKKDFKMIFSLLIENLMQHEYYPNENLKMRIYLSDTSKKGIRVEFLGSGREKLPQILLKEPWFTSANRPWDQDIVPAEARSSRNSNFGIAISRLFDYLEQFEERSMFSYNQNILVGWKEAEQNEGLSQDKNITWIQFPLPEKFKSSLQKEDDGGSVPPFKEYPEFNFGRLPNIISKANNYYDLLEINSFFDETEESIFLQMSKVAKKNGYNLEKWLNYDSDSQQWNFGLISSFLVENLMQHEYSPNENLKMRIYLSNQPYKGIRLEFWGPGKEKLTELLLKKPWFSFIDRPWKEATVPKESRSLINSNLGVGISQLFDYIAKFEYGSRFHGKNHILVGWREDVKNEGPQSNGHIIAMHIPLEDGGETSEEQSARQFLVDNKVNIKQLEKNFKEIIELYGYQDFSKILRIIKNDKFNTDSDLDIAADFRESLEELKANLNDELLVFWPQIVALFFRNARTSGNFVNCIRNISWFKNKFRDEFAYFFPQLVEINLLQDENSLDKLIKHIDKLYLIFEKDFKRFSLDLKELVLPLKSSSLELLDTLIKIEKIYGTQYLKNNFQSIKIQHQILYKNTTQNQKESFIRNIRKIFSDREIVDVLNKSGLDYLSILDIANQIIQYNQELSAYLFGAFYKGLSWKLINSRMLKGSLLKKSLTPAIEINSALKKINAGEYSSKNKWHILVNYSLLDKELLKSYQDIDFKSFIENNNLSDNSSISSEEALNIRGLVYEASILKKEVILPLFDKAKQNNRKIIVVANSSYGVVAVSPITEERTDGVYIAGTDIPVWYSRVGSTEAESIDTYMDKSLFNEQQLKFILKENPYVIVVDGSKSIIYDNSGAHVPNAFKGYRNYFALLNQALYGAIEKDYFYENHNFQQQLLNTVEAEDFISEVQGIRNEVTSQNPYDFYFWYQRNETDIKSGELLMNYQNINNYVYAKKTKINEINVPSCIFVQTAIHTKDVDPKIKEEYILGDYRPAYFDDKEQFEHKIIKNKNGQRIIAPNKYVEFSRQEYKRFERWQEEDGGKLEYDENSQLILMSEDRFKEYFLKTFNYADKEAFINFKEDFREIIELYGYDDFYKLIDNCKYKYDLLSGMYQLRKTFGKDLKYYWPDISELGMLFGDNTWELFLHTLPAVVNMFSGDLKYYWPGIMELAKIQRQNFRIIVYSGLPQIRSLFGENLKQVWPEFINKVRQLTFNKNINYQQMLLNLVLNHFAKEIKNTDIDYLNVLDLAIEVTDSKTKLGFHDLNMILEGIKQKIITKDMIESLENRKKITGFSQLLGSFSPELFKIYLESGTVGLKEVFDFRDKVLKDQVGVQELKQLEVFFESKGVKNIEAAVIASIQMVVPNSSSSFVAGDDILELYKQYLEAGDLRDDVPLELRDKDFGNGSKVALVDYVIKKGEVFDVQDELKNIVSRLYDRNENDKDRAVKKQKILQFRINEWFMDYKNEKKKQEVLNSLYDWTSCDDVLWHKVASISGDYNQVQVLKSLFTDEDELIKKVKEVLSYVKTDYPFRTTLPKLRSADKRAEDLTKLVKKYIASENKTVKAVISNFLGRFTSEDVKRIIENIKDTEVKFQVETIAQDPIENNSRSRLSVSEIIAELFANPLELINKEELKFELQAKGQIELEFKIVKGIPYGFWGVNGGLCNAMDVDLWKKKEFKLMAMIDKNNKKVMGFAELLEKEINGQLVLIAVGMNPSSEFLEEVSAKEAYTLIEDALINVAVTKKYAKLYFPTKPNIFSNRNGINDIVKKKYKTGYAEFQSWEFRNTMTPDGILQALEADGYLNIPQYGNRDALRVLNNLIRDSSSKKENGLGKYLLDKFGSKENNESVEQNKKQKLMPDDIRFLLEKHFPKNTPKRDKSITLEKEIEWNTLPQPNPFNEVYEVWNQEDGGIMKRITKIGEVVKEELYEVINPLEFDDNEKAPPFQEYKELNFGNWPSIISKYLDMGMERKLLHFFMDVDERILPQMYKIAQDNGWDFRKQINANSAILKDHYGDAFAFLVENLMQHEYSPNENLKMRVYLANKPYKGIRIEFWGPGQEELPKLLLNKPWFTYNRRPWNTKIVPDEARSLSNSYAGIGIRSLFEYLEYIERRSKFGNNQHILIGWREDKKNEGPQPNGHIISMHVPIEQNDGGSSKRGGIDFTHLPIMTQKAIEDLVAQDGGRISKFLQNKLIVEDIDKKLNEIQNMLDKGMIPAANRIKECVQSVVLREDYDKYLDKLLSCISDTMRLEEEKSCTTNRIVKDLLLVLDSGMTQVQLKQVFTAI